MAEARRGRRSTAVVLRLAAGAAIEPAMVFYGMEARRRGVRVGRAGESGPTASAALVERPCPSAPERHLVAGPGAQARRPSVGAPVHGSVSIPPSPAPSGSEPPRVGGSEPRRLRPSPLLARGPTRTATLAPAAPHRRGPARLTVRRPRDPVGRAPRRSPIPTVAGSSRRSPDDRPRRPRAWPSTCP